MERNVGMCSLAYRQRPWVLGYQYLPYFQGLRRVHPDLEVHWDLVAQQGQLGQRPQWDQALPKDRHKGNMKDKTKDGKVRLRAGEVRE